MVLIEIWYVYGMCWPWLVMSAWIGIVTYMYQITIEPINGIELFWSILQWDTPRHGVQKSYLYIDNEQSIKCCNPDLLWGEAVLAMLLCLMLTMNIVVFQKMSIARYHSKYVVLFNAVSSPICRLLSSQMGIITLSFLLFNV